MNTTGQNIKLTIFGESHGESIGMVLDGFPPGEAVDFDEIHRQLARRAPGNSEFTTPRKESDNPLFQSGIFNGKTTGAPICAIIRNTNTRSKDYHPEKPRPSHADLTAQIKFKGANDFRGGGPFSGRLTAPMVIAGSICMQLLERKDIIFSTKIVRIGKVIGSCDVDNMDKNMQKEILNAKEVGDSVGGIVECTALGVPAGIGGLMFGGMESRISSTMFAIPGVKGIEFGAGFDISSMRGSIANDPIVIQDSKIFTETNNAGGINGGITNGMPLIVRCAFRPTPSISCEQNTVDMDNRENTTLRIIGRHDPCIVPRAVPVVENLLAFCILDALLDP